MKGSSYLGSYIESQLESLNVQMLNSKMKSLIVKNNIVRNEGSDGE